MCEENVLKPYFPNKAAKDLLEYAKEQFENRKQKVHLVKDDDDTNELLNPRGEYPHAFVLACIMDRQISAGNAWKIPKWVKEAIHRFDMKGLLAISEEEFKIIFKNLPKKHRYPDTMATCFYKAVKKIHEDYDDDASNIWKGIPPSGVIVSRFLQFEGVGVKIASMATNILVRQFGIKVKDNHCIDISPDTHAVRVFQRLHLVQGNSREETIYMAREINPEYPGILDYPCWDVGKKHCHARNPDCKTCPFFNSCPSNIEKTH